MPPTAAYAPWVTATAGYVAVLAWLTWPLPLVCADHLPDPVQVIGAIGWAIVSDIHHGAWTLAWCAGALVTEPAHVFDANIFYPAPQSLAYAENYLGHMPVALPVYTISRNPVLTFNVVLLTSYLGCALAMHALAWRWTRSHVAAFGAGLVYAFNPWRLSQAFWLEYRGAMYLPLIVLALERWSETRRWRALGLLMACLFLQTLCSYYLGYAAFLVAGLLTALLIACGRLRARAVAAVAGAGVLAAAVLTLVSAPYLRHHSSGNIPPVDLAIATLGSLQPGLAGPGGTWFPGWSIVALSAVGIARRPSHRGARLASVTLLVAGLLLALGPDTTIGSWRVPLPYRWFHAVVPGFDAVRFPAMFMSVAVLGLAGLTGLGLATLGTVASRARVGMFVATVTCGAAAALVAFECSRTARMAVRPVPVGEALPAVYRALAAAPGDGVVLELPLGGGRDPRGSYREAHYMLLSTYHRKPMVNGYAAYTPPTYDFLAAIGRRLPDPEALGELVDLVGLRWIVLHDARRHAPAWNALEQSGSLRRIVADGDDALYEVRRRQRRNVLPALRAAVTETPATTLTGTPLTPLPRSALRAEWRFQPRPTSATQGRPLHVRLTVRNIGRAIWPGWGVRPDGLVVAELRWLNPTLDPAPRTSATTVRLPADVDAGQSVRLDAWVGAPDEPGRYLLEARLRQVGREDRLGPPFRLPITVRALQASPR